MSSAANPMLDRELPHPTSAATNGRASMNLARGQSRTWRVHLIGLGLGVTTQLLFLVTAINLFWFLRDGGLRTLPFRPGVDLLLALFFMWPHSLLLMPTVQRRLKAVVPAGWLGCVHCLTSCGSLLLLFGLWTSSQSTLWDFTGLAGTAMLAGFYGSWLMLFYSLYLTGLGYQTGLIPWWHWLRDESAPRREFAPRSLFRWMRHPVYLSFLGLIWFTPRMTIDHAILTAVWTGYIYFGSYLKDRRLEFYLGDNYRQYAQRVTGFPLIGFGPWGRW